MSVELRELTDGKVVEISVTGKLTKDDYAKLVPEVERLIGGSGRLNILLIMKDFHGWTMGALWDDIKFDVKHFGDIERLAIVGDKKWQEGMATFCKPFTTARIRYFVSDKLDDARRWIGETSAAEVAVNAK